jgi:hypothetical protein
MLGTLFSRTRVMSARQASDERAILFMGRGEGLGDRT